MPKLERIGFISIAKCHAHQIRSGPSYESDESVHTLLMNFQDISQLLRKRSGHAIQFCVKE